MRFVNEQRDPRWFSHMYMQSMKSHYVLNLRLYRLNEILYPYCTLEKAIELIDRFEQNKFNAKVSVAVNVSEH